MNEHVSFSLLPKMSEETFLHMFLPTYVLYTLFYLHSDLLEPELLYRAAAAAELLVGELRRTRKQCCRAFLTGLLQEHWEALGGREKAAQFPIQDLSPTSSINKFA